MVVKVGSSSATFMGAALLSLILERSEWLSCGIVGLRRRQVQRRGGSQRNRAFQTEGWVGSV